MWEKVVEVGVRVVHMQKWNQNQHPLDITIVQEELGEQGQNWKQIGKCQNLTTIKTDQDTEW